MKTRKPRYRHPAGEQIEIQWDDAPEAFYCHGHRTPEEWIDDVELLLGDEDADTEALGASCERLSRDPGDWVVRHRWARWEARQWGMVLEVYPGHARGCFPVTEGVLLDTIVGRENSAIKREVAQIIDRNLVRACFPGAEYSEPSGFGHAFARYPGWFGVGEVWYRAEPWEQPQDYGHTTPGRQWVYIAAGDQGYWCQIATGRIDGRI